MNCLILILLLLCGNNGSCFDNGCGCNNSRANDRCGCGNNGTGRSGGDCDCGCDNDRQEDDGCGRRNDFRSEPRFEQRPFTFNANQVCGCEEPSNNNCDR